MWSEEAWEAIEHVYAEILKLEFVKKLGDGTLDRAKFLNYMQQDKLYLNDYMRALALIAAKVPNAVDCAMFGRFSQNAAIAEQELHDFYLEYVGEDAAQRKEAQKNVTCELYTSFLLKHAALSPVEVAAAAVLPCFWIYDAVGVHHTNMLQEAKNRGIEHPYARWIELYSGADFNADTNLAIKFCNKLAERATPETRRDMIEAFVKAAVMELMFWNAAWIDEKWII